MDLMMAGLQLSAGHFSSSRFFRLLYVSLSSPPRLPFAFSYSPLCLLIPSSSPGTRCVLEPLAFRTRGTREQIVCWKELGGLDCVLEEMRNDNGV